MYRVQTLAQTVWDSSSTLWHRLRDSLRVCGGDGKVPFRAKGG